MANMTLYEAIYARRQVRKFNSTPLEKQMLHDILKCVSEAEQLTGQSAGLEIVSADAVNGNSAPHYLLSYCDNSGAAYANVGFVLQKVDLYIQSTGIGSGWFMQVQPKEKSENYCIALAFGTTDMPTRKNEDEFKRLSVDKISPSDNAIARAVRLAPSAMNSQPWKLEFADGKVVVKDVGRGIMRAMLKSKLNKIDVGIATRHAMVTLENEGKKVTGIVPKATGKEFEVVISYE